MIKKVSSINHSLAAFYFYSWKKVSVVACLLSDSSYDKTKDLYMTLEKLNQLNGPYIGFESVFVALD